MATRKRGKAPRGVVLLIILALMAMFGMVVIAFVLVTDQAKRAAESQQRIEQYADSAEEQLNRALLELAHGSNNPRSVASVHGLLEDMNGDDLTRGVIAHDPRLNAPGSIVEVRGICGGEIIEVPALAGYDPVAPAAIALPMPYRHVGCVLTMTSGPARGQSTRIVGYDPNTNRFQLAAFQDYATLAFVTDFRVPAPPLNNARSYMINGLPFSGTGIAFNVETGMVNIGPEEPGTPANPNPNPWNPYYFHYHMTGYVPNFLSTYFAGTAPTLPYALLPNPTHPDFGRWTAAMAAAGQPISANEDYDAVDNQNMLLAGIDSSGNPLIPSLHRPAVVNFWYHQLANWLMNDPALSYNPATLDEALLVVHFPFGPDDIERTPDDSVAPPWSNYDPAELARVAAVIADFKRRIVLRPLHHDHPDFNGSNAAPVFAGPPTNYWYVTGPWDVDNDGDGLPDSIWVDLGFPARQLPDGRWYKPLFAPLCEDLGGRLNLNAHGNLAQTLPEYYNAVVIANPPVPPVFYDFRPGSIPFDFEFAQVGNGSLFPVALPRGQGYGPADVNLMPLFQGTGGPFALYQALLTGRYGANGLPGANGDEVLSWNKFFFFDYDDVAGDGIRKDYWAFADMTNPAFPGGMPPDGAYGSPYDLNGDGLVALDPGGRPLHIRQSLFDGSPMVQMPAELVDDPYERNLFEKTGADAPFTINELERLLRPFDRDVPRVASRVAGLANNRHGLTTEQWDVPCPSVHLMSDLRARLRVDWNLARTVINDPASPPALVVDARQVLAAITGLLRANRVIDLLTAKIYWRLRVEAGFPDPLDVPPPPPPLPTDIPALLVCYNNALTLAELSAPSLLAPELLAGLKMDLNRPFGDGRDTPMYDANGDGTRETGNGIVDDPEEAFPGSNYLNEDGDPALDNVIPPPAPPYVPDPDEDSEPDNDASVGRYYEQFRQYAADGSLVTYAPPHPLAGLPVAFNHTNGVDYNGDGVVDDWDRRLVRQAYARHLYCLMMLTCDLEAMDDATGLTGIDARRITARGIAQYVVNVVDFRDRDSIMTPFEYDLYPFTDPHAASGGGNDNNGANNPWDVDGRVGLRDYDLDRDGAPDPLPAPQDDAGEPYRGLVWGFERPELLITEALATHDRRVQNLPAHGTWSEVAIGTPPPSDWDEDFDQLKMPQGSFFVELYNPTSDLEPRPGGLSTAPGEGVDLRAVAIELDPAAPDDLSRATEWPVWRVWVVPGTSGDLDPDHPDPTARPQGERCVYFVRPTGPDGTTPLPLGDDCNQDTRFYPDPNDSNLATIPPILPGRYAVVGPGEEDASNAGEYVTYLGTRTDFNVTTSPFSDPTDTDATRQIRLQTLRAGRWDYTDGSPVLMEQPGPPPGGNIGGSEPDPLDTIQQVLAIPVNLPRRLNISEPTGTNAYPPYTAGQAYGSSTSDTAMPDEPLDYQARGRRADLHSAVMTNGTTARVCVVHLQRLANPLRPYDPDGNPYVTIDSAPVDLAAFNGWDVDDVIPPTSQGTGAIDGTIMFAANQRGEGQLAEDLQNGLNNVWVQRLTPKSVAATSAENPVTHRFPYTLKHSLGYLTDLPGTFEARRCNNDYTLTPPYIDPYRGFPATIPFPWLTWSNRPFVSQMELLVVPRVSSSRLLCPRAGSTADLFSTSLGIDPYGNFAQPFRHLMNFFYSPIAGGPMQQPFQLHRLMDFVHVPSRFVGTELQGSPAWFDQSVTGQIHLFNPPFSHIPLYREPGRVNLNTIFMPGVWQGLINYFPDMNRGGMAGASWRWDAMTNNRRGYTPDFLLGLNTNSPTRFANPFRTYAGRDLVPLPAIAGGIGQEVNATMLRQAAGFTQPLFEYEPTQDPQAGTAYTNANRDPYFRYQALSKLGNLVTTRSNTYAVWITVGYFEVHPRPTRYYWDTNVNEWLEWTPQMYRDVYPDGFALGLELGSDTGEAKRHRAFYVFDRTIPVGFERGEDHNVGKAVLLKRFIE